MLATFIPDLPVLAAYTVASIILGLTPGPDIVSQLLMATPMIVLYNLSIIIAFVVTRRRAKREAEARAAEGE